MPVRIELSDEQAVMVREILEARWTELLKEIRHTDHREFREMLRARAAALEQVVAQLEVPASAP